MRDVKLETGEFNWGAGIYQPPANGAERVVPFDPPAPHEEHPEPAPEPVQAWAANVRGIMDQFDALPDGELPQERVNLDKGTAVFRGHSITLSPEGLSEIMQILAAEVCRTLVDEQVRIVKSLQLAELQGDSHGGQDMHEVPVAQVSVEQGPPSTGAVS